MSTVEHSRSGGPPGAAEWEEMQRSAEFVELRRRLRGFVFPMTIGFLAWYLLYVLMATYARGFMSDKVVGNINVGLIFGLLEFLSTFVITAVYVRYADRRLDPLSDQLRRRLEGED